MLDQIQEHYLKIPEPLRNGLSKIFKKLPIEETLFKIPLIKKRIEKEYDKILSTLDSQIKPYKNNTKTIKELPKIGFEKNEILKTLESLSKKEKENWSSGQVSGGVYHGEEEFIEFQNKVYELFSQTNPLHFDIWPSLNKFESEVVSMTKTFLGGNEKVIGNITSGGTESILLAMKTYRDRALREQKIKKPEIIVPRTAHAAFDKACDFFGIKKVTIDVDENYKAKVSDVKKAITSKTIAIVGSAPCFPYGTIDPIFELAKLAYDNKIGFHTDACLGGFVLPFCESKHDVPGFDFRVRGVTSISVDTHKYGYGSKGSSVVLYKNKELGKYQYFTLADWPGGLYLSPTLSGSRPGAIIAQSWAAMVYHGKKGYEDNVKKILDTASFIKKEITKNKELKILGNPLWVIAFSSNKANIYEVLEQMSHKGWFLNGLHKPPCIHICVTLLHTKEGVAEKFIKDLNDSVEWVLNNPNASSKMAPIYGLAGSIPTQYFVNELLCSYMERIYRV